LKKNYDIILRISETIAIKNIKYQIGLGLSKTPCDNKPTSEFVLHNFRKQA